MSPKPLPATPPLTDSTLPSAEDLAPLQAMPGEHLDGWLGLCATAVVMLAGAAAALV
jgi:hypothetical protein